MNHIGDTNKMVGKDHLPDASKMVSDTPRTDAVQDELINQDTHTSWLEMSQTARQLERELNAANQRIKRLEEGILKDNQEIEQTCGKVLGYPWFKDDQKNFHGATEKDGVCVGDHVGATIVSELAKRHTEALARIKRMEEAGVELRECASWVGHSCCQYADQILRAKAAIEAWDKEAKP